MNLKIGLLLCIAVYAARAIDIKKRVIGGQKVRPIEVPYHATLNINGYYVCGATLITKLQLLTAAHCLDRFVLLGIELRKSITVLVGSLFLKYGYPHQVKRISHHKGFSRLSLPYSLPHDIGVIHLSRPIVISRSVAPIALPVSATTIYNGAPAVMVGYGCQNRTGKPVERLWKIVLTITALEKCQNESSVYRLDENNICAISEPNFGCSYGDDGGGLTDIFQDVILGVLSISKGHANSKLPDLFVKVLNYIDYINEEINYDFENQPVTEHPSVNYFPSKPQITKTVHEITEYQDQIDLGNSSYRKN